MLHDPGGVLDGLSGISIGEARMQAGDGFVPLGPTFVRGDANADGGFDIGDPIKTLDYLFASATVDCVVALDSNDDEGVDIGDAIWSLSALFSSGPLPLAPHPDCGVDSTRGGLPCDSFPAC